MKLTVVSIYHNRQDYIQESIDSVVEQLSDNMQLLLVDDGSTDDTYIRLKEFERNNVKVITQKNMGFTKTIINAIENSDSEFVAIHGSGDVSLPGRLKHQLEFLESNPDYGVVGCYCHFTDMVTKDNISTFGHDIDGDVSIKLLSHNIYTHGEVMFTKSFYDQAGGYRKEFKYSQDYDLWLRMSSVCKFHTLKQTFYKRMVNVDGSVNSNAHKLYHQLLFSEFAKYCHTKRLNHDKDPLDSNGTASLLEFTINSKSLIKLWKKSILEGKDFLTYCPSNSFNYILRLSVPILYPFRSLLSKIFGKNKV